ncbi:hypothetical protein Golomagni_02261 [Golovinomyces magnicellulatus]|nr:hypothetical protein Golomagni_02261 [Golovinomyces magnicellulatus]
MADGLSHELRFSPQKDYRRSSTHEYSENFTDVHSRGHHPLASKVTSILSTSYADSDIKDALEILDKQGLENTPVTRRQLRYDIQKEVIESSGQIIGEFGHVAEQLKKIGVTIKILNQECQELKNHIFTAQNETAPALEEASVLLDQKDQVEVKELLLRAFNDHFFISEDDISVLTSNATTVNDEFFVIFSRAKKIQKDCEILLGTENQRLGLEIMEQISKNIDNAFQKLYRWIQREFRYLNLENPQITSSIRRALRVLAERPSLFQSSLDFFADARESTLSDSFYSALSGTSVTGERDPSIVKPIELAAHDPLRYVGDMLAWTHSTTVSEREALEVLFISDGVEIAKSIQAGRKSEPWNQIYDDDGDGCKFDGIKALNQLVDRDFNGVARILRQRIGQLIHSHEETIIAYKIVNLLNFYRVTFSKLLDHSSVLVSSLSTLEESAMGQFRILIRDHVANLQADNQVAPANYGAPEFLYDGLKQLTAIMKTYETSFASIESREVDFKPILDDAFDPFMGRCEELAKDMQIPIDSIFYTNCLLAAKKTLSLFDFTKQRLSMIQKKIDLNVTSLVEYQYSYLRNLSGLDPILQAISSISESENDLREVLPSLESLKPISLEKASKTLDNFLSSALIDARKKLYHLQDSSLAREITEEAVEKFCVEFEQLEQKLVAIDENVYYDTSVVNAKPLRTIFPRTTVEIRVLLS